MLLASAASGFLPLAARADAIAVINALRTKGCGGAAPIGERVRPIAALDDVARELASKTLLEAAFQAVEYPAASAASLHLRGAKEDDVVRSIIEKRYCDTVEDPQYKEVGVFETADEIWIVLSVPRPTPLSLDPATVERRVLELVNAARAAGRRCGDDDYPPALPLTLAPQLYEAALEHSRDMAETGTPSHEGSDGSRVGERIKRAGYAWQAAGENVAAGQTDADDAVDAWLESPPHCAALMAPYFKETGVAVVTVPSKNPATYWTEVFAAPR
jgi:uncharacterized protein YkwD